MRTRLRALLNLLQPTRPLTTMHLPATDEDGDPCWLMVCYAPTDDEIAWASSDCAVMRSAYAVHACTKARNDMSTNGWLVGWPDDA